MINTNCYKAIRQSQFDIMNQYSPYSLITFKLVILIQAQLGCYHSDN